MLDAHRPLLAQPTQQRILLGCSQDVHSSVRREKCPHSLPTYPGLLRNVSSVCFAAARQRCLFSPRRSAPMLIVALHLRGSRHVCVRRPRFLKPGSALLCHHPGSSEKACIGVFRPGTLHSAVLGGKSPQLLLRSLEPDGSFAHAGACVL